jgi:hypothetical protein
LYTISPENKPPKEGTPEELSLEVESPEEKMKSKILRSRYIIQEKYGIEINLLSTIYLLLIVNLNHKPSKSIDIKIIGQFIYRIIDQSRIHVNV